MSPQTFIWMIHQPYPKAHRFNSPTLTRQIPDSIVINQTTTHSKLNGCIQHHKGTDGLALFAQNNCVLQKNREHILFLGELEVMQLNSKYFAAVQ